LLSADNFSKIYIYGLKFEFSAIVYKNIPI